MNTAIHPAKIATSRLLRSIVVGCIVAAAAPVARGDTLAPEVTNTIYARFDAAASGGGLFVYKLEISGGSEIRDVDAGGPESTYVTIFDFQGLLGTPTFDMNPALAAAGFAASVRTPPVGATPPGLLVTDQPGVPNISVDFSNADPAAVYTTAGTSWIGTLTAHSTFADAIALTRNVASYDYRTRNGAMRVSQTLTDTTVPAAGTAAVVPVPSVLWGGASLIGGLFALRLRKRGSSESV